jgi:hypothetical protein
MPCNSGVDRRRRDFGRRVERSDREGISRQEDNNKLGAKEN